MKHAVLIMALKNPHQLARLVKAIVTTNMDVIIHLDNNWKKIMNV